MFFQKSMKKSLAERGYKHRVNDEEFTKHGEYARSMQYAFSKEFSGHGEKVVDIIFLGADMNAEKIVIGFFRENVSVENGILENADTSIPLTNFSIAEFEKQLDRLIPKGSPVRRHRAAGDIF